MASIHTEYFKIRTSEINQLKCIQPHALIQLMQEASMQHTISMKVSVWDLEAMNASWVLLKMQVNFYIFPTLNETVKVETFPSGIDGYFTYRDYYVYDGQNRLCATISSMWTLMNMENRKMMKIPDSFGSLIYDETDPLTRPNFKLLSLQTSEQTADVKVNYLHLDWNGHVNNVQYIKMIMESLDPQVQATQKIKSLDIQYKTEALLGQELTILHQMETAYIIQHVIRDKHTGRDLILAKTEWVDIQ
ncbi:MAG: hypothetical protein IPN89_12950 [Saprospiraceae bacterium]|nr:hypothetical protein [Saprospiraceae bacterium]